MARKIEAPDGHVWVQGFRGDDPYVFIGGMDSDSTEFDVVLPLTQANELAEFIRQEAEFAQGERKEMA